MPESKEQKIHRACLHSNIINRFNNGETVGLIAYMLETSIPTVYRVLKKNKINTKRKYDGHNNIHMP